jgi:DNA gyrase/topoisomerase IV subunit B
MVKLQRTATSSGGHPIKTDQLFTNDKQDYNAASLEVLKGLDPVRRRPGMYTDTQRPNHLAQEVIDNSVDEAIAGFASRIDVILHADGSLSVADNGRGMPTDIHPEEGITGVEVILMKLHAGAKFSNKDYQFSGGLHGVGVSVVNALSTRLEVEIRRDKQKHFICFAGGNKQQELAAIGTVGQRNTGTTIRFWPDARYFDTGRFSVKRLRHTLRAKAVLCPKLTVTFFDENTGDSDQWYYEDGLKAYLASGLGEFERIPDGPFVGQLEGDGEAVSWAVIWLPEGGETITESYVNLIPTAQGGTHVNGFRSGLLAAIREFCEFRKLIPRGIKLTPRRHLEPLRLRAVSQNDRSPVFRPDQRAPLLPPVCLVCQRRGQRCVQLVVESAHGRRRTPGRNGHRKCPQPPEGRPENRSKKSDRRTGPTRKAGRLHQPGPHDDRVVSG